DAMHRFEYEAQVLASLVHPVIAQIYDAGTQLIGGGNVPYFAMELIPGAKSNTQYARQQQLDLHPPLALFCQACDAVHHGHQRGIIHRDLKPSNTLVDSSGRPRIIDFGVARSMGNETVAATLMTSPGQIIGTLAYMSPEQCGGPSQEVDVRCDVY